MEVVKWLTKEFGLIREDAISEQNVAIRMAYVKFKDTSFFEWLIETFDLRRDDIMANGGEILKEVISRKDDKTMEYLCKKFGKLTPDV